MLFTWMKNSNNNAREFLQRVRTATKTSDVVKCIAHIAKDGGVQFALGETTLRALSEDEVTRLEALGNSAEDWSRVRVAAEFDCSTVRHCRFHGDVVLGGFRSRTRIAGGIELPTGVFNSTLSNCVIGDDSLVQDVRLLANYVVAAGSVLLNCGSVVCDGETSFGNGNSLAVGIETGGREVAVFAEIDIELAAGVAKSRSQKQFLADYSAAVQAYAAGVTSTRGIVAAGASVRDTSQVRNSFVGPHARIDGAALVAGSTLLGSADEPVEVSSGAVVTDSLLQWGSRAATSAIVERSVLTEHSHVGRHGKVTESIVGPNTGVAGGEVTACLLGPFVGFHHQALLIAVLWPEGKGNVGYGANIGSNHTSKAPDQECWPGEGAFFGLGANIKFPADLSRAPYSIIATGVSTLPQKVTFPFSLINNPSLPCEGISPAYNEIIPAWLLTDNTYAIKRSGGKYKIRNKARRTQFTYDVLRSEIVEWMRDACRRLESVRDAKEFYTDRDIEGLGKNFMLEIHRQPAMEAYRFYVRYYALLGLKTRVQQALQDDLSSIARLLTTARDEQPWEHQRRILHDDLGETDVAAALRKLPSILEKVARDVEESKAKDDRRGQRIIDDYTDAHTPASDDKFVRQTWQETRNLVSEIANLIAQL